MSAFPSGASNENAPAAAVSRGTHALALRSKRNNGRLVRALHPYSTVVEVSATHLTPSAVSLPLRTGDRGAHFHRFSNSPEGLSSTHVWQKGEKNPTRSSEATTRGIPLIWSDNSQPKLER